MSCGSWTECFQRVAKFSKNFLWPRGSTWLPITHVSAQTKMEWRMLREVAVILLHFPMKLFIAKVRCLFHQFIWLRSTSSLIVFCIQFASCIFSFSPFEFSLTFQMIYSFIYMFVCQKYKCFGSMYRKMPYTCSQLMPFNSNIESLSRARCCRATRDCHTNAFHNLHKW